MNGEEGRLRPDLLVRLPGGRTIVVDAKTPLEAYLRAIEAPDEATRKARLADHARQVRTQMTALEPQGLLGAVRTGAGVRGAVPAGRVLLQRGPGKRPDADRDRGGAEPDSGDARPR